MPETRPPRGRAPQPEACNCRVTPNSPQLEDSLPAQQQRPSTAKNKHKNYI